MSLYRALLLRGSAVRASLSGLMIMFVVPSRDLWL